MDKEHRVLVHPSADQIAEWHGKPKHIDTTLWNLMDCAGVKEVPEGMDNEQFAAYLNQKYREKHPNSKGKVI